MAVLPETPPDMALDLSNNFITPPEDYDYPEKWDDFMQKMMDFSGKLIQWQQYLEAVKTATDEAAAHAIEQAQQEIQSLLNQVEQAKQVAQRAANGAASAVRQELQDLLAEVNLHSSALLSAIAAANMPVYNGHMIGGVMVAGESGYEIVLPVWRPPAV